MAFGEKIKELRTKNGFTQKDIAEKLNVTAQAVSRWESNEVEPSIGTIKQMATIFNVSTDELLENPIEPTVVEKIVEVEKPIIVEKTIERVVEKPVEKVIENKEVVPQIVSTCYFCNKPIYDNQQYFGETHGRSRNKIFIHSECAKSRNQKIKEENATRNKTRLILSFVGGSLVFLLIFGIFAFMANKSNTPGQYYLLGSVIGVLLFAMVSCFIIGNNFLFEFFTDVAGWSVKFPGVIFSFDLDGFKFLIFMKLLFFVIGIVISIVAFLAAVALCSLLAIFVYPYALIKNIKYREEDQIE